MSANGLKLFVVGHESGNPDDWGADDDIDIVAASTPEEAREVSSLGQYASEHVAEIQPVKAGHLMSQRWSGRDAWDGA